jgi:hypothetical protein
MAITVIPEAPADEWDLDDWVEKVAQEKPGGAGAFSHQMSEDTLVITLPGNQVRSCIRQVLGWAWSDVAAPWQLRREAVAVQHPRYPWLRADAVSVQPHNPLAQLQTDLTYKPKSPGVGFPGYAPEYHACYARADVTVRFRPVYYQQWSDYDPTWDARAGKEWLRNFGCLNKAYELDLISAEGANDEATLYWAEGVVNGAGDGPRSPGDPFNGSQFVRVNKTRIRMIWKNVPVEYACGEVVLNDANIATEIMPLPRRLVRALGMVNSAAFPGSSSPYGAGTLLLSGVEEILYQQPVRTDTDYGLWAADYILTFDYTNPPINDSAVTNPAGQTRKRGWHLYPWRVDGKWYFASKGAAGVRGTYSGRSQLEEMDFHDLFRHVSDPAYTIP